MPRKKKEKAEGLSSSSFSPDLFGKKNDKVGTPPEIYEELEKNFGTFDFDPCPLEDPRPLWNGLEISWGFNNYVNPPFSDIKKWVEKALKEAEEGKQSVFLITARISSKYWFDLIWPKARSIWFLEGATQFAGYTGKLPVPLAVVLFGKCAVSNSSLGTVTRFNSEKRWIQVR